MKRRTVIGLVAGVGALVVGAGAVAFGGAHHGGRHAIMKRVVAAEIDEALDRANVTPEQRASIHGARDRAFAALEDHGRTRRDRVAEALALFEADAIDAGRVEAFRRQAEGEHRQVGDAITQALVEIHDVLTPDQRRAVTAYIRSHRWN
jgi:Spy/CpxP family protein refolding chaperone